MPSSMPARSWAGARIFWTASACSSATNLGSVPMTSDGHSVRLRAQSSRRPATEEMRGSLSSRSDANPAASRLFPPRLKWRMTE